MVVGNNYIHFINIDVVCLYNKLLLLVGKSMQYKWSNELKKNGYFLGIIFVDGCISCITH